MMEKSAFGDACGLAQIINGRPRIALPPDHDMRGIYQLVLNAFALSADSRF
jgi:hypothetical protein